MIIADLEAKRQIALARGMTLANSLGARVEVVGFCYEYMTGLATSVQKDLQKCLLAKKREWLEAEVAKQTPEGLKVKVSVVWEKSVHRWVIERCAAKDYFAVIKTAHRSGNFLYTSTDWHLLRECPAPVLIEADKKWNKARPILASLDLETKHTAKRSLNDRVMAHAQEIARANGSELHVAYAIVVPTLLRDMDLIDVDAHELDRRRKLKPVIDALCEKYGLKKSQVHLKTGQAPKVIPSIANKLKADLVVMGTVGRRGIKGKLIGNTAEQVLQLLRTDVLAVK